MQSLTCTISIEAGVVTEMNLVGLQPGFIKSPKSQCIWKLLKSTIKNLDWTRDHLNFHGMIKQGSNGWFDKCGQFQISCSGIL